MADHNEGIEHGYHAHLGIVSKRVNSTKRTPLSELPDVFPFYMKRACSMEHPVFYVRYNSLNIAPKWNYCYIEETEAYYWIEDITALNANNWQFTCTIDPLATYSDDIKKTKAYILYGFNEFDASGDSYRIADSRQNVAQRPTVATATAAIDGGAIDAATGCYILSAVGKEGGVTTYVMKKSELRKLIDSIQQDITDDIDALRPDQQTKRTTIDAATTYPSYEGGGGSYSGTTVETYEAAETTVDKVVKYAAKNLLYGGAATECIRSCLWLPIKHNIIPQGTQNVYLGSYDTGVSGGVMGVNRMKEETDIAIPWPVSDWKRMNCQILLYVPFVGTVGIPVDKCNNASSVHVTWCVSFLDGDVSVRVDAGEYTCNISSVNISSPYAIGTSNVAINTPATAAIAAIGASLSVGGGLLSSSASTSVLDMDMPMGYGTQALQPGQSGKGLGSFLSSAGSSIMQLIPPVTQCVGSMGGNAGALQSMDAKLCLLYYPPTDDAAFQGMYGHPVLKIATPAAGYCQTRGFSCNAKRATSAELAYINGAMDGGVFIE